MDASGKTAIITLIANLLAERLDEAQLVAVASLLTQLGSTLGFIAAQQASDSARGAKSGQSQLTNSGPAASPAQSSQEATGRPPSQGSAPSRKSPGPPEASSATGR